MSASPGRITALLVVFWLPAAVPLVAQQRNWSDGAGKLDLVAEFVELDGQSAVLRKEGGDQVRVPLERLSKADHEHIRSIAGELPQVDSQPENNTPVEAADSAETRLWTERSTNRSVEGEFVGLQGGVVVVQRPDGRYAKVLLRELSDDDQEFVRQASRGQHAVLKLPSRRSTRSPGDDSLLDKLVDKLNASVPVWVDRLTSEAARIGLKSWLERPKLDYVLAGWLGSAIFTALLARVFGRSLIGWLALGALIPGLSAWLVPLAGERGILPVRSRSVPIFLARTAAIVTSVAGLCGSVYVAVSLNDNRGESFSETVQAADPRLLGGLLGVWLLSTLLVAVLAALLLRSTWGWLFLAVILPFIAGLVLSVSRSLRSVKPWAVVVTMRRNAHPAQIQTLRMQGDIEKSAVVVCRRARVPRNKGSFLSAELNDLAVAEARKLLPADLRTIPLTFRGIQRPGGPMLMLVRPELTSVVIHAQGTRQPEMAHGICCDTFAAAHLYWASRKPDEPFLRFGFKKQSSAERALEKLPCIQRSKQTGKLTCNARIHFGCYPCPTGASDKQRHAYEAFIGGNDISRQLWKKAESHFRWLGGRRIDALAPGDSPKSTSATTVTITTRPAPSQSRAAGNTNIPRCRYMFVLGGGFEPTAFEAATLKQQFISSNSEIDFSNLQLKTGSIKAWTEQDKSSVGAGVIAHVRIWGLAHGLEVNGTNIIYNDYYDPDQRPFAVAAYLDKNATNVISRRQ